MTRGLEAKSYDKQLRELGITKRRVRQDIILSVLEGLSVTEKRGSTFSPK